MPTNERTPGQLHVSDDMNLCTDDGVLVMIEDMPVSNNPHGDLDRLAAAWNAADALGWKTPEDCARGAELWREMELSLREIVRCALPIDDAPDEAPVDRQVAKVVIDSARALLAKLGDSK